MKRLRRISALLVVFAMVLSLQMSIFAEVPVQQSAQPVELPSAWAMDGVQWAAIYGLANQDMFSKYASNVSREELYAVCVNLYERITGKAIKPAEKSPFTDAGSTAILKAYAAGILAGSGKLEPQKAATRLEVVAGIYNAIKSAQPEFNFNSEIKLTYSDSDSLTKAQTDIVKYAVEKEILKGRSNITLNLIAPCTRQELMIFAKKAYEFSIYESGRDSKGVFWKVSDADSSVYLVGSVHVADPSMYPLSTDMLKAFDESDALVVEADITNQTAGMQYMQQKMMYTDENTLDKNIPKELYDSFAEVVAPFGIAPEVYNKFKPWYAAMLVQNIQLSQNSYYAGLGIDLFFMSKVTGLKDIMEVEGLKFQVDMFDSFSKELQIQYLEGALSSDSQALEEQMKQLESLMKAWKSGDCIGIEKILETEEDNSPEMKEFNEKMWTTRNDNMTEKVKTYLADPEGKTYFVVVGAGHVVGEDGIVSQLKGQYEIEQIK